MEKSYWMIATSYKSQMKKQNHMLWLDAGQYFRTKMNGTLCISVNYISHMFRTSIDGCIYIVNIKFCERVIKLTMNIKLK